MEDVVKRCEQFLEVAFGTRQDLRPHVLAAGCSLLGAAADDPIQLLNDRDEAAQQSLGGVTGLGLRGLQMTRPHREGID